MTNLNSPDAQLFDQAAAWLKVSGQIDRLMDLRTSVAAERRTEALLNRLSLKRVEIARAMPAPASVEGAKVMAAMALSVSWRPSETIEDDDFAVGDIGDLLTLRVLRFLARQEVAA